MKIVKKPMSIVKDGKVYEWQAEIPTYSSADDIAKNLSEKAFVKLLNYAVDLTERAKARSKMNTIIEREKRAHEAIAALKAVSVRKTGDK